MLPRYGQYAYDDNDARAQNLKCPGPVPVYFAPGCGPGKGVNLSTWPYPRIFAHRCGGVLAPENSLAALRAAHAQGCRAVEFDVMLTASGVPVVIHDETLDRTTLHTGRVCELQDEELATVRINRGWGSRFVDELLPTFAQVAELSLQLGLTANIEIKPAGGYEMQTGRVVAGYAARFWQRHRPPPLLSSFSTCALEAARTAAQQLPRGWLVDQLPADWLAYAQALGVVSIHVNVRHLTRDQVQAIKRAGFWLVVYTENTLEQAGHWLAEGVDAVITDRPDLMCVNFG